MRLVAPQPVWIQPESLYVADPPARYRLRAGVDDVMTDRTEYTGRLVEAARASGSRLVAMVIPEHIAVDPLFWKARFEFLGLDPAGYEPGGPRRIFRGLLEKHGIAYLDLTEVVEAEEKRGHHLYFAYDSHFTPEAHALAARELEGFLRETAPWSLPDIPPPRLAGTTDPTPGAALRRPHRLAPASHGQRGRTLAHHSRSFSGSPA